MKNILIFGSLPSGLGGMEKVFRQVHHLMSNESGFNLKFFMYELNIGQNDRQWLTHLDYSLYQATSNIRFFQKRQFSKALSTYLKNNPVDILLVYDPLSIYLAHKIIKKLNLNIDIYSWIHFSVKSYRPKYQNYIKLADKHLVLCQEMKNQFIEFNLGHDDNIFIVYNPISPQSCSIEKPKDLPHRFLYVGRVQYSGQKNIQMLFRALSRFPEHFQFDIIGDGSDDDKSQLINLAKELSIEDKIVWHGWQKDAWSYIKNKLHFVTALIMSSKYEGFPMTLCEAISFGILCVSSDCETGPKDIINEQNGLLFPIDNVDKCVESLQKVIQLQASDKQIKQSIDYLYDQNYFARLISFLK